MISFECFVKTHTISISSGSQFSYNSEQKKSRAKPRQSCKYIISACKTQEFEQKMEQEIPPSVSKSDVLSAMRSKDSIQSCTKEMITIGKNFEDSSNPGPGFKPILVHLQEKNDVVNGISHSIHTSSE